MNRAPLDRATRGAALAIACVLAPPALFALRGGVDLTLGPDWRVAWFETLPILAALGLALLAAAAPAVGRLPLALRLLAVLLLSCAALVLWSGGIDSELLSLRRPGRPTILAAVSVAALLVLGRRGGSWPTPRSVAVGAGLLILGAGLLVAGVGARDRQEFDAGLGTAPADLDREARRRPDVLMILADTLRADALGSFGNETGATPFLDELAARVHAFDTAWAQAPWTVPSVASLFTSLHPSSVDPEDGEILRTCGFAGFRLPRMPTLASLLRAEGYVTLGFQKNPLLRPGTGFEQGFQRYEVVGGDRAEGEAARHMTDAVLRAGRRIAERRAEGDHRPAFVYAHYMDPHLDYSPPRDYQPPVPPGGSALDGSAKIVQAAVRKPGGPTEAEVERMRALYAAEVRYLDDQLRRLLEGLREAGLFGDDAVTVFLSDHGEQFGEHGRFEHCDIHRENLRIPLLIGGPGVVPGRTAQPVRLLDVMPTLLEMIGGATPLPPMEGRSLVPLLEGRALAPEPAVSEHKRGYRISTDTHALLVGKSGEALFDVAADPQETRDLIAERPALAAALRLEIEEHRARPLPETGEREAAEPLDSETREALRALGYLE